MPIKDCNIIVNITMHAMQWEKKSLYIPIVLYKYGLKQRRLHAL